MSSMVPCAPSNITDSPRAMAWLSSAAVSATKGAIWRGDCGVLVVHLVGVERLGVEQGVRDRVLLAAGVLDVGLEQLEVEQVGDAQAAAAHLVLVGGADAARGGADLHASGGVLRRQLDHAVVGQDDVGAVADEEVAVRSVTPALAQRARSSLSRAIGSSTTPLPMTARQPGRSTPQGMSCRMNFLPRMMTVWPALWPPA